MVFGCLPSNLWRFKSKYIYHIIIKYNLHFPHIYYRFTAPWNYLFVMFGHFGNERSVGWLWNQKDSSWISTWSEDFYFSKLKPEKLLLFKPNSSKNGFSSKFFSRLFLIKFPALEMSFSKKSKNLSSLFCSFYL